LGLDLHSHGGVVTPEAAPLEAAGDEQVPFEGLRVVGEVAEGSAQRLPEDEVADLFGDLTERPWQVLVVDGVEAMIGRRRAGQVEEGGQTSEHVGPVGGRVEWQQTAWGQVGGLVGVEAGLGVQERWVEPDRAQRSVRFGGPAGQPEFDGAGEQDRGGVGG
jgi:hypothetical protein